MLGDNTEWLNVLQFIGETPYKDIGTLYDKEVPIGHNYTYFVRYWQVGEEVVGLTWV